jgi:hypothetical protein
MDLADALADISVRGDREHIKVGVSRDQSQQLTAGVAAATSDRDAITHVQHYASSRNFIPRRDVRPANRPDIDDGWLVPQLWQ